MITHILVGDDPDIVYVGQPREYHVKVIDLSSGRVVRTIGRRGAGPGEVESITRLSWHGDTLVVADRLQGRISLFDTAGTHVRTERTISRPLPPLGRPALGVAMAPGGRYWGEVMPEMMLIASGRMTQLPVVLMNAAGEVERTLASLRVAGMMAAVNYGRGVSVFVQPLADRTLQEYAPDGSRLALVDMDTRGSGADAERVFTVTMLSHTGQQQYRQAFRYRAKPVETDSRDSLLAVYADNFTPGNPRASDRLALAREHVAIPALQPPVSDVLVSGDGSVWLRREEIAAPDRWAVLDAQGRHIANVTAPARARLLTATGSFAFGSIEDELGVPYIVRYRIERQ